MTSEERQQQINTLVDRFRELDLEKRAMNRNRLFLHIVYKEVDITFAAEQKTVANGK